MADERLLDDFLRYRGRPRSRAAPDTQGPDIDQSGSCGFAERKVTIVSQASRGLRRVRGLIADSPNSLGGRARARRWEIVDRSFPRLCEQHVLDLGGTVEWWLRAPVRPAHVTVVNLLEPGETDESWLTPVVGDACAASSIDGVTAGDYDVVFSNSLLEHVGGHAQRVRLAEEISALAPKHYVQTPYRYFPVEPHWIFPGMQFLPIAARSKIAQSWPLSHSAAGSAEEATNTVMWTELVSITEMRSYFPDSQIVHERFAGLTKSLIAIRV